MPTVGRRSALNFSSVNLNQIEFSLQGSEVGEMGNQPEHEGGLANAGLAEHQHLEADQALQDLQQGDVGDRLSQTLAPDMISTLVKLEQKDLRIITVLVTIQNDRPMTTSSIIGAMLIC